MSNKILKILINNIKMIKHMAKIVAIVFLIVGILLGISYYTYTPAQVKQPVKSHVLPVYTIPVSVLNTFANESQLVENTTNQLNFELHFHIYNTGGSNGTLNLPYYKVSFDNLTVLTTLQNALVNWSNITGSLYTGYILHEITILTSNGSTYNLTNYTAHFLWNLINNSVLKLHNYYGEMFSGQYQFNGTLTEKLSTDYLGLSSIVQDMKYITQYNETYVYSF